MALDQSEDHQSYHNSSWRETWMPAPYLIAIRPVIVKIFQSGPLTLTSMEPLLVCMVLNNNSYIWGQEIRGNRQKEFGGLMKRSRSIRIYCTWDECPNVSADPDDPSGELCMQPVTCCLSVTKPVKGELIIPAGWFPEASVALGLHTAAWLFDGHLNYSGSWLIMGQPVATLPRPASCCRSTPPTPPPVTTPPQLVKKKSIKWVSPLQITSVSSVWSGVSTSLGIHCNNMRDNIKHYTVNRHNPH